VAKRYLVNDTTVEKLDELLNHHPQRAAPVSGRVERLAPHHGPAGHENDRAFYCEAWNGTNAYTRSQQRRPQLPPAAEHGATAV
jgi:putative DNA primase/helicase